MLHYSLNFSYIAHLHLFLYKLDFGLHFKNLLKKLGLRHIRFHDLRHSCVSLLLAKGIPMKAIQEWLGHSNFSTTANIYTHLDSNSKQLSAQAITSAFETKKEIEECDSSTSSNKLVACAN